MFHVTFGGPVLGIESENLQENPQLLDKPLVLQNLLSCTFGKSPLKIIGKSTISRAIFNSYVTNYQRV